MNNTHTTHCKHCLTSETVTHFDNDDGRCVCGYKVGEGYWTVTLAKPGIDESGEFNGTYSGLGYDVAKGQAFSLPECDVNVNFYTFKGWVVGSESTGLEALDGATFLYPGENYTPTGNVTLKAHYELPNVSLADDADNRLILYQNNGKLAQSVTLAGRTLYKDDKWNTLCLPFNVTIADSPLTGADVRTLSSSSFDSTNGELTLNFTDQGANTTIEAGKPYIIKWASGSNLTETDLVFSSKTISATTNDVSVTIDATEGQEKSITFRGTYASTTFTKENKSILLLGGGNTLYYPKPVLQNPEQAYDPETNPYVTFPTIGAQRAYFQLNGLEAGEAENSIKSFVLNFGDEESTAVEMVNSKSVNNKSDWYDLSGRKLNGQPTQKGIYVNNGKKIAIK